MRFHLLLSLLPACSMLLHGTEYRFPDEVTLSRFQNSGPVLSVSSPEVRNLKGSFQMKKELPAGVYLARMKYRTPGVKNVYLDCQVLNMKQKPVSAGAVRIPAVPDWEETACLFRMTASGRPSFSFYSIVFSAMPAEHYRQPGKLEVSGLSITRLESDPLLVNGDFRLGKIRSAGWWVNSPDDSVFPVKVTDADGGTFMRLSNPTKNTVAIFSHNIPVKGNQHYRVSFQARTPSKNCNLTFRMLAQDWKWAGGKTAWSLWKDWRNCSVTVQTPEKIVPVWLNLLCGPGVCEIRNFRMEPVDAAQAAVKKEAPRYPWLEPKSTLVHNGNFNAGMTGWSLHLLGGGFTPEFLAARYTSGQPVIRKEGGNPYLFLPANSVVRSWEMPYRPGEPVRVSFRARSQHGKVQMMTGITSVQWAGGAVRTELTPEWKNYDLAVNVKGNPYKNRIYLFLSAPQDVCIDDIVVFQGEKPDRKFDPVSLGIFGDSIFKLDQKNAVKTLTAVPAAGCGPCTVTLTVRNAFGKTVREYSRQLDGKKEQSWTIPVNTSEPGFFLLTAEARDGFGAVLGRGMGRCMVIDPLTPEEFEAANVLGVCYFYTTNTVWEEQYDLPIWKAIGVKYLSMAAYHRWYDGEKPAAVIVQALLPEMRKWRKEGFKVILRVGLRQFRTRQENRDPSPAELQEDLRTVCSWLAAFLPEVDILNYGGECNIWRTRSCELFAPAERLMLFVRTVLPEVRKRFPGLRIVGPSVCGTETAYTMKLIDLGAGRYYDQIGLDAYRSHPDLPFSTYQMYETLQRHAEKAGFRGGFINLEQNFCMGSPLVFDNESGKSYTAGTEFDHAVYYAHSFIQQAAWETAWAHFQPGWNLYTPMTFEGGCPFMSVAAIAACHKRIAGAGRGVEIYSHGPVKMYLFPKARKGPVLAVFSVEKDIRGTLTVPGEFQAADMFGTPVRDSKNGISVSTAPVYLQFRSGTEVEKLLEKARFKQENEGPAFTAGIAVLQDCLKIRLRNMRMEPFRSVRVELDRLPAELDAARMVNAGDFEVFSEKTVTIPLKKFKRSPDGQYRFEISVLAAGERIRLKCTTAPVFAVYSASDEPDWSRAEWSRIDIASPANRVYSRKKESSSSSGTGLTKTAGDRPLYADYSVLWNERGIHLAVRVTGSEFLPNNQPSRMYEADSLQVYFDQKNNAESGKYDGDDTVWQIGECGGKPTAWLEQAPSGRFVGADNQVNGIDRMVRVRITREKDRVFYRMFFPKAVFPHADLKAGSSLGFSLFVHDLTPEGMIRGISLNAAGPYRRPDLWNDLLLLPPAK